MADRIQQRRDTAARWTQFNPILLEGEVGYELDTDQYKVGDGVKAWNDLPYRGDPCLQRLGTSTTTPVSQDALSKLLGTQVAFVGGYSFVANIDTTAKTFTFSGDFLVTYVGGRYEQILSAPTTVVAMEYGSKESYNWWNGSIWLIWDKTAKNFRLMRYTAITFPINNDWYIIAAWYGNAAAAASAALLCLNSNAIKVNGIIPNNVTQITADMKTLQDVVNTKMSENQFNNEYFDKWVNSTTGSTNRTAEKIIDSNSGAGAGALTYLHGIFTQDVPAASAVVWIDFFQLLSTDWPESPTAGPVGSGSFFETGDVVMMEVTYRSKMPTGRANIVLNYSNRYPSVYLPNTDGVWKTVTIPLTIVEPAGNSKCNMRLRLDNNGYSYAAGDYIDLARIRYMNMRYPWGFKTEEYHLYPSDTIMIDDANKIHVIDLLGNKFIGADAEIKAVDAWKPMGNAVYSDVVDGGKKWYNCTVGTPGLNNNSGFIGKNVGNLIKAGAVVSRDTSDNYFHVGDTIYFKVRVKGTLPVTLILEYLNPNTESYIARATPDSHASLTVLGDGTQEVVIMAAKTINAIPDAAAAFDKIPIGFCIQWMEQYGTVDRFIQLREITISKTPFSEDSIILSPLDADWYKQEEETEEMGQSSAAPTQMMGNDDFIRPISDINTIVAYGQSNGSGQQTAPSLSVDNFRGNLQVGVQEWWGYGQVDSDRQALNPLKAYPAKTYNKTPEESRDAAISDQMLCESQAINFANASKNLLDKLALGLFDRKYLDMNFAIGGTSIELLSKNCPNNSGANYNNLIAGITRAKALADAATKSINVGVVTWIQGEYNASQAANQGWTSGTPATNDPEQYKAYLKQLVTDIRADVKTIFGQDENPLFMVTQPGTGWLREFQMYIWMALLEASQEDNRIVMACPVYMVTNRGHLDPNGQRWVGEFFAKVYYKTILKGQVWKPLCPQRIVKGKNNIVIDFFVPAPPLRFDQLTVKPVSNYGFVVRNNGVNTTIQSVKLISATQVEITCVNDFTGYVEIGYASYGTAYGNLCDSDDWRAFSTYQELPDQLKPTASGGNGWEPKGEDGLPIYNKPYPCQNFSVQFYYRLEQNEDEKIINI